MSSGRSASSTSPACRLAGSSRRGRPVSDRRAGDQRRPSPTTSARCKARYPLLVTARSWREPRPSCATRPRPAATCSSGPAAITFYDDGDALQQARARHRLPGNRRREPHPRDLRRERQSCIATHPSDMCVALAALERDGAGRAGRPATDHSLPVSFTACRATTPERRHHLRPDEIVVAVDLPEQDFGRAPHLSEAARPALLRLRPGLGGRRP